MSLESEREMAKQARRVAEGKCSVAGCEEPRTRARECAKHAKAKNLQLKLYRKRRQAADEGYRVRFEEHVAARSAHRRALDTVVQQAQTLAPPKLLKSVLRLAAAWERFAKARVSLARPPKGSRS